MIRPYLKWIGGKTQLAVTLTKAFPDRLNRYLEPFCGSAALFFNYYSQVSEVGTERDMFNQAYAVDALLNDTNMSLMNCHEQVSKNLCYLLPLLEYHEQQHFLDPSGYYLKVRNRVTDNSDALQSAADFIYINKTCFNGIWRVNSKGKFNVPFNKKSKIVLASSDLKKCSEMFRDHATFSRLQFDVFIDMNVKNGDFVFLDPPYVPLSVTSSFTSYTEDGWTDDDNARLVKNLDIIDSRGAKFMMTNSSASLVYELFEKWSIKEIKAHRFVKAISGEGEKREKVDETIITNY